MYSQLIDKSNYFRGLLLLASRDNKISEREQGSIKKIARILNYEQEFVENALSGLLENQYISKEPPEFADKEFARAFIKDGIKMVFVNWTAGISNAAWNFSSAGDGCISVSFVSISKNGRFSSAMMKSTSCCSLFLIK